MGQAEGHGKWGGSARHGDADAARVLAEYGPHGLPTGRAGHPQAGHPRAGHPQAGHPRAGHPRAGPGIHGPGRASTGRASTGRAGHPQAGHPRAGPGIHGPGIHGPGRPARYPPPPTRTRHATHATHATQPTHATNLMHATHDTAHNSAPHCTPCHRTPPRAPLPPPTCIHYAPHTQHAPRGTPQAARGARHGTVPHAAPRKVPRTRQWRRWARSACCCWARSRR
jgi:hypothetical protein